ncbi:sodium-coupled monocarboxylate transporter 1-like [Ptychodera flava]|uniref:sodium-coupled monocarboxylate transporter 1-like n=1 Tax=Ptychodera flava TaxID=63121 RepID=UPI003969CCC8
MSVTSEATPFSIVDYLVFSGMLAISTLTGIYHGFAKGGQHSTTRYLLADKSMHFLPVAMSILVSFMSPLSIMGTPAEVYTYGTGYTAFTLCYLWCLPLTAYIFIPVFMDLKLVSSYQYMDLRFNFYLRILVSMIFMIQSVLYTAACLVGPALAIEAVQDFEMWKTLIITGALCTLYTTLGGMKGVIWTDVFQFFVIIITLVAVIILGVIEVGGFNEVFRVNGESRRYNHFNFDLDVTRRTGFFSGFIGGAFSISPLFISQTAVQRYMTVRSLKHSQASVMINVPFALITGPCLYLCGMVLYAYYNGDLTGLQPSINGTLPTGMSPVAGAVGQYEPNYSSSDQILVYFISSKFGNIPGIQGLFVACLFAGTLSSVSSSLNAMTAITLEDFIKPYRAWKARRHGTTKYQNDQRDTVMSKILTCVYGIAGIGLAFLASTLGSLLVLGFTVLGITGAPILGTFGVGMMYKRANTT